ncbi:MAG: short-chain dehydrogenase [Rhodobacteraceae bacterium]|nr:MAG: short-chain dehydrogenase [Paracoccaceae bacterium]
MKNLFDVAGLRVLITGGATGIGLATAQAFYDAGAFVFIAGFSQKECDEAKAELGAEDARFASLVGDLSSIAANEELAAAAIAKMGGVDALICSAGIEGPIGQLTPDTQDGLHKLFAVNIESPLWLSSILAPLMAQQGGGSLTFIASIAGLRGNGVIGAYGMTKAATAQMARNLAVQWGPKAIRANVISPGLTHTKFADALIADKAFMARRMQATPLRRVGQPHEIAGTALYLASPAGAFVTGQNIVVDGGTLISDGS